MSLNPCFADDLAKWGPTARRGAPAQSDALAYCRRLAKTHYENFPVVSWLLPRRLHRHFYSIYAYCRWADDLADEVADAARSTALLEWWRQELAACYLGRASHPVFVALLPTIGQ